MLPECILLSLLHNGEQPTEVIGRAFVFCVKRHGNLLSLAREAGISGEITFEYGCTPVVDAPVGANPAQHGREHDLGVACARQDGTGNCAFQQRMDVFDLARRLAEDAAYNEGWILGRRPANFKILDVLAESVDQVPDGVRKPEADGQTRGVRGLLPAVRKRVIPAG